MEVRSGSIEHHLPLVAEERGAVGRNPSAISSLSLRKLWVCRRLMGGLVFPPQRSWEGQLTQIAQMTFP